MFNLLDWLLLDKFHILWQFCHIILHCYLNVLQIWFHNNKFFNRLLTLLIGYSQLREVVFQWFDCQLIFFWYLLKSCYLLMCNQEFLFILFLNCAVISIHLFAFDVIFFQFGNLCFQVYHLLISAFICLDHLGNFSLAVYLELGHFFFH